MLLAVLCTATLPTLAVAVLILALDNRRLRNQMSELEERRIFEMAQTTRAAEALAQTCTEMRRLYEDDPS